ncbi:MAG: signal transduction histidine kinase/DNA-binding response OmpR family regulator [Sulfurimonas sp.]|jgi:signal transduction histidine kinase/DNA-binding response OmpR family regulator|uniref:ATP-binding protein n=1 Tax=Sulfurimonas sp. TaxID=2022749 RepID=UPI0039E497CB
MKFLLVWILLFSSMIQAEYLRTIRIASFNTQAESEQALEELVSFISSHDNVLDLEEEWGFEFKARRSGRYYITIAEPFTQRKILQEVIDTLRTHYSDVYVTSMKKKDIATPISEVKKKPILEQPPLVEEESVREPITEVVELTINQDEFKNDEMIAEVEVIDGTKVLVLEVPKVITKEFVEKDLFIENLGNYVWKGISLVLFMLVLFLLRSMLKHKKDNEIYFNSDMIHTEKHKQLSLEIKDREKYLSHASHELRAPMTAIMGLTHLVLDSDLGKQEKEYIKQIENSATNLLNIVNDILDVSKIKAGELHIEKAEFNINDILQYVLNIISMQAKNNNINCLVDIDKDVPSHLIGDSLRLGQVLINLLGNAVKFTKDGDVSLSVKKVSDSGDVVSLEFIVEDDGIGMTEAQLETVFQSFTQANDSTSRKFGGTGLGLSISQELVRMMNGEIKVKSEVSKGTTFSFSIAFKLKDHLNKRQYRLPSAKYLNKRILVVDSSGKNVMQLIQMLGHFKYRTHTIPSFLESVLDETMQFDIVIINKNQLNAQTIEILMKMQKEQKFKIVILSELFSSLNNEILKNIEVDSYLQTPFNQQSVLNMIIDLYAPKKLKHKARANPSKNILQSVVDKKILIAEDNEVNHKVITGLLANTGIEITYVINGKEALDILLSGRKFDLVLMDINMPIMNGFEATQEIRKHKVFDTLAIFALTADVMDDARNKTIDVGMQGYISKPIIIDIFYKKIYEALHTEKKEVLIKSTVQAVLDSDENEYEEISIKVGLERYNNDKMFYNSILKDFKKMYINSPLDLEELCGMGNYKEARHKAMDIKDVALSIGAYKLCESAATMEYNLEKGPRSNWVKLIAFYELELAKLFKDIDAHLKKSHV